MKEYNEQVVETLDDAGCIIANKNIIIDNLQARIAELEAENERLKVENRDSCVGLNDYYGKQLAYVLDALWDKQCDKIVTQKWAEILTRNKRVTGASSAEDSSEPTSSE